MDAELMKVGELLLPKRLVTLIDAGLWPHTAAQARRLDHNCNVPKERIHLFAPEENQLYLAVPPFHTIAQRVSSDESNFWSRFGALEQISPDLSVDIGFFGLGSDSAIVLDYRQAGSNPPVLRLKWRKPEPNVWALEVAVLASELKVALHEHIESLRTQLKDSLQRHPSDE